MLRLKGLYCTKIVHISRLLRGVDGHGQGQELAAIVPNGYCTKEIGDRQEKSAQNFEEQKTAALQKPQGCGTGRRILSCDPRGSDG